MSLWQEAETRLTPEAKRVLDDLVDDIRRQTVLSADQLSYGDEVTARDVIEAFQRQARTPGVAGEPRVRRLSIIVGLYAVFGVATVTVGFLVNYLDSGPLADSSWVIIVSGASLSVAAAALLQTTRMRLREHEAQLDERRRADQGVSEFLRDWIAIESEIRLAAASLLGSSASEKPVSQLAKDLARAGFLSSKEADAATSLHRRRNALVHGGPVDEAALRESLRETDVLLSALHGLRRK
jgi:hypothetical protein